MEKVYNELQIINSELTEIFPEFREEFSNLIAPNDSVSTLIEEAY